MNKNKKIKTRKELISYWTETLFKLDEKYDKVVDNNTLSIENKVKALTETNPEKLKAVFLKLNSEKAESYKKTIRSKSKLIQRKALQTADDITNILDSTEQMFKILGTYVVENKEDILNIMKGKDEVKGLNLAQLATLFDFSKKLYNTLRVDLKDRGGIENG